MKIIKRRLLKFVCIGFSIIMMLNGGILSNSLSAATVSWYYYYTGTTSGNDTGGTRYLAAADYYISRVSQYNKMQTGQNVYMSLTVGTKTVNLYLSDADYVIPNNTSGNSTIGTYSLHYDANLGGCSARGETRGAYGARP